MKVQAFVGERQIDLNVFVETYIANIFSAIANSLRGVKFPRRLEFTVEKGIVAITSDGDPVELNGFAAEIVNDTVNAILKQLRGFSPDDLVRIVIEL